MRTHLNKACREVLVRLWTRQVMSDRPVQTIDWSAEAERLSRTGDVRPTGFSGTALHAVRQYELTERGRRRARSIVKARIVERVDRSDRHRIRLP